MVSSSKLASSRLARLRLRVTAAAESWLRGGHPWLYEGSVREQNRPGELGELAAVFDRRDRFLAVGLFDPTSPIRLRVLHAGKPRIIDAAWWLERLDEALTRRAHLFDADTGDAATDGYRLISGESDGWPGLVLDRYADALVLKLYAAAWFPHLGEVLAALDARLPGYRVVLRLSRNIQGMAGSFGWQDGAVLRGEVSGPVIFRESGLRFEADVLRGQKTGFFLDQRDNRRLVGALAANRRVLNAFSFSGGFSLYAARGGAASVLSLDISKHALESAARNFALNADVPEVAACPHEQVRADVFAWLSQAGGRRFDLIVLDPPSLARRETERAGAIRAYGKLAEGALELLADGGILMSASCSAHVSEDEFFGAVRSAARASGREFRELRTTGHAPDHPASFPEARYLKAIYLAFD